MLNIVISNGDVYSLLVATSDSFSSWTCSGYCQRGGRDDFVLCLLQSKLRIPVERLNSTPIAAGNLTSDKREYCEVLHGRRCLFG